MSWSNQAYLHLEASYLDRETGILRTWTASRSEADFAELGIRLMGVLGTGGIPAPPPPCSSAALLQGYLRRVLESPDVMGQPFVYDFLEVPADMTREPVLLGEVR